MSPLRRHRGFTLLEMVISAVTFTAISIFLLYTIIEVGKQTRKSLTMIPSDGRATRAADRVRWRAQAATIGSVAVRDSGRTLLFQAAPSTTNSKIFLDSSTKKLKYQPTADSTTGQEDWGKVTDVLFTVATDGKSVTCTVTTPAVDRKGITANIAYKDVFTLRN